jgi:hypothetical protein
MYIKNNFVDKTDVQFFLGGGNVSPTSAQIQRNWFRLSQLTTTMEISPTETLC